MKIEIAFGPRSLQLLRFIVAPPLWLIVSVGLFDIVALTYGVTRALG